MSNIGFSIGTKYIQTLSVCGLGVCIRVKIISNPSIPVLQAMQYVVSELY